MCGGEKPGGRHVCHIAASQANAVNCVATFKSHQQQGGSSLIEVLNNLNCGKASVRHSYQVKQDSESVSELCVVLKVCFSAAVA